MVITTILEWFHYFEIVFKNVSDVPSLDFASPSLPLPPPPNVLGVPLYRPVPSLPLPPSLMLLYCDLCE